METFIALTVAVISFWLVTYLPYQIMMEVRKQGEELKRTSLTIVCLLIEIRDTLKENGKLSA